jgi:hypothetical protein
LGLAFGYGALAQFCAGMWEFKRDNTFGTTAFSSYGVFWIAFALLVTFHAGKIPPAALPATLGTFFARLRHLHGIYDDRGNHPQSPDVDCICPLDHYVLHARDREFHLAGAASRCSVGTLGY